MVGWAYLSALQTDSGYGALRHILMRVGVRGCEMSLAFCRVSCGAAAGTALAIVSLKGARACITEIKVVSAYACGEGITLCGEAMGVECCIWVGWLAEGLRVESCWSALGLGLEGAFWRSLWGAMRER